MSTTGGGTGFDDHAAVDVPVFIRSDVYPDSIRSSRVVPASEVSYEDDNNESGLIVPPGANHWNPAEVQLKVDDLEWESADYSKCSNPNEVKIYLTQLSTLLRIFHFIRHFFDANFIDFSRNFTEC